MTAQVHVQKSTRVTLKNILFATDFSSCAQAALPYVESIARHYGAKTYIAHVMSPATYGYVPPEAAVAFETMQESTMRQLQELADEPVFEFLPHETLLAEGEVVEELRKIVVKDEIDLLVLGTHGRHGLGKIILGSVTDSLLHRPLCPILTVGPRAPHVAHERGREPDTENLLHRILLATDLTPESDGAREFALSLAQENQAQLTVLSVLADASADPAYALALFKSTLERVRGTVPEEAEFWCKPECLVDFGPTSDVIVKQARTQHSDLIVVGVSGCVRRNGHPQGKVSYEVISRAPCPVLAVPTNM